MTTQQRINDLYRRATRLGKLLRDIRKEKSFKGRGKIARKVIEERSKLLKEADKLERKQDRKR